MADENGIGNGTEDESGPGGNDNGNDGTNWNDNWFDGPGIDYLANLKGVTIPNTTPPIDTNPRRGKHSSSDNTITADDPDIQPLIKALNAEAVNSIPWPTEPRDVSGEFGEQGRKAKGGKNQGRKGKAEAAPEVTQTTAPKSPEAIRGITSLDTAIQDAPPARFATTPIPEKTPAMEQRSTMQQMPDADTEATDDVAATATVTLPPQSPSNRMTSAAAYRATDDPRSNLANLAVTTQKRRGASNANYPTRSGEATSAFDDAEQFVDASFQTGEIVNDAEKPFASGFVGAR